MAQFRAGNVDSSLIYLEKSVETYRKLGTAYERKLIPVLFVMGNIYNIMKQLQDAEQAWRDAYEAFGSMKGASSYLYPEIKRCLTEMLNASSNGHA
jgi:hypothetical protein